MRGLSFGELLDYCAEETNHWREWFRKNPAAGDLPCDIAFTKNVRELVLHIAVVQMRYAERLLNLPITEYNNLSGKTTGHVIPVDGGPSPPHEASVGPVDS